MILSRPIATSITVTLISLVTIVYTAIWLGMNSQSFIGAPGILMILYTLLIWVLGFKAGNSNTENLS